MVHGDSDLSTLIEDAEESLHFLSNAHLIRVRGGTQGAFRFRSMTRSFPLTFKTDLDAPFAEVQTVAALDLPEQLDLPKLQFVPLGQPTLYEARMASNRAIKLKTDSSFIPPRDRLDFDRSRKFSTISDSLC